MPCGFLKKNGTRSTFPQPIDGVLVSEIQNNYVYRRVGIKGLFLKQAMTKREAYKLNCHWSRLPHVIGVLALVGAGTFGMISAIDSGKHRQECVYGSYSLGKALLVLGIMTLVNYVATVVIALLWLSKQVELFNALIAVCWSTVLQTALCTTFATVGGDKSSYYSACVLSNAKVIGLLVIGCLPCGIVLLILVLGLMCPVVRVIVSFAVESAKPCMRAFCNGSCYCVDVTRSIEPV